jgi:hypothetical protein
MLSAEKDRGARMRKNQAAFFVAGKEGLNPQHGVAKYKIGARSGAIADTQPYDLGRAAKEETSLREI